MAPARYAASAVRGQIAAVLAAWGMPGKHLGVTADLMVETDLMGVDSHGVSMLILYDEMQKAGQLRLDAEPTIVRQSKTTALLDGGANLGHAVSAAAMRLAVDKAKACDVGVVSVFNSHHFGACGVYAMMATRENLIGIVSSSSRVVTVVPTNGAERALGTNPVCLAAPRRGRPPVMIDMSTSVVSANKVKVYALNGKPIPAGWVTDGEGRPVTDSGTAYEMLFRGTAGGLAPLGGGGAETAGYKGYGLGIFAQILSSTLSGGSFSPLRNRTQRPGEGDNIGHFFMALNPDAFRPFDDFEGDLEAMLTHLAGVPPVDAARPVLIPGDPEWNARADRERNGIPLPDSLVTKIRDIAKSAGAEFLLTPNPRHA